MARLVRDRHMRMVLWDTAAGVGGVVPKLVGGANWPFVALGGCYAILAVALFMLAGRRQRAVERALEGGSYAGLAPGWVTAFTFVGSLLALGTFVAILAR